jgi:hypothetical protein
MTFGTNKQIILDDFGNYFSQYWKFISVPEYPGWYKISNNVTEDKVLDIINGINQLWMTNSVQYWKLTLDNGWYRLSSMWHPNNPISSVNDGVRKDYFWISESKWKLAKLRTIKE